MNRWRMGALLAVLVPASALVSLSAPAAAPADEPGALCSRAGVLAVSPGLTVAPRVFTVTDTGTFGPCRMPDGSIQSATVFASGSGYGGCQGGDGHGVFTIMWSDGRRSAGTVTATFVGSVVIVTPTVTQGEFAGGLAGSLLVLTLADPSPCASTGVTEARYQGVIGFSRALVGG